jgi:cytochrome c oxidase subunit 1
MTGRLMSERLGRWHFWLSLIAAYGTFFPMHLEGLAGRPRHFAQVTGSTSSLASLLSTERGVTWAAFVLGAAQILFLINLVWSACRGQPAGQNPWQATTLEWQTDPLSNRIERGPYEYHSGTTEADFTPQWETASQQE